MEQNLLTLDEMKRKIEIKVKNKKGQKIKIGRREDRRFIFGGRRCGIYKEEKQKRPLFENEQQKKKLIKILRIFIKLQFSFIPLLFTMKGKIRSTALSSPVKNVDLDIKSTYKTGIYNGRDISTKEKNTP